MLTLPPHAQTQTRQVNENRKKGGRGRMCGGLWPLLLVVLCWASAQDSLGALRDPGPVARSAPRESWALAQHSTTRKGLTTLISMRLVVP